MKCVDTIDHGNEVYRNGLCRMNKHKLITGGYDGNIRIFSIDSKILSIDHKDDDKDDDKKGDKKDVLKKILDLTIDVKEMKKKIDKQGKKINEQEERNWKPSN